MNDLLREAANMPATLMLENERLKQCIAELEARVERVEKVLDDWRWLYDEPAHGLAKAIKEALK